MESLLAEIIHLLAYWGLNKYENMWGIKGESDEDLEMVVENLNQTLLSH